MDRALGDMCSEQVIPDTGAVFGTSRQDHLAARASLLRLLSAVEALLPRVGLPEVLLGRVPPGPTDNRYPYFRASAVDHVNGQLG